MDGSNGSSKMIELLERIARGVENTNLRLDTLEQKVDKGFAALETKIDMTNKRIDNLITILSPRHADHERRISALEKKVFKKSG